MFSRNGRTTLPRLPKLSPDHNLSLGIARVDASRSYVLGIYAHIICLKTGVLVGFASPDPEARNSPPAFSREQGKMQGIYRLSGSDNPWFWFQNHEIEQHSEISDHWSNREISGADIHSVLTEPSLIRCAMKIARH